MTLRPPAERSAVLQSANRLKKLNLELRQQVQCAIGVDVFLTKDENAVRYALWPKFKVAKEAGQKAYFDGCKLFLKGSLEKVLGGASRSCELKFSGRLGMNPLMNAKPF